MGWAEPGSYGFIRTLSVANDTHADSKFWHNRMAALERGRSLPGRRQF
jgi:hypothetical protein